MQLQVHVFPLHTPATPGVLRGIVLPVVRYLCQAHPCSLGAYVMGPFLSAQGWPLLPGILLEQSRFPIPYLPESMLSDHLSILLGRCPN
jgi:hypothetical protein